jgi:hypothetical protein
MVIPLYGLIFFICYLGVIWFLNALFIRGLKGITDERRKYVQWLALSNIFLASGDSVLFLSLLISFVQGAAPCDFSVFYLTFFSSLPGNQFLTVPGGIFATSITMSFYYLFLGFYIRDKFGNGKNSPVMFAIYILFAARIFMLFNPHNIWLASCLPEHTPNYSAWLRNAPFFVYGILTIIMLAGNTLFATADTSGTEDPSISKYMLIIVASLICSFFFYGIDIFFSHNLPKMAIWMTYILKTIAYIVVAITMWRAEFKIPVPKKAAHKKG